MFTHPRSHSSEVAFESQPVDMVTNRRHDGDPQRQIVRETCAKRIQTIIALSGPGGDVRRLVSLTAATVAAGLALTACGFGGDDGGSGGSDDEGGATSIDLLVP